MRKLPAREVARLKKLFMLADDWEIAVEIDTAKNPRGYTGITHFLDNRRAHVVLHPEAIKDVAKRFPSETLRSVLYHEFGEIVAAEAVEHTIPRRKQDTDEMMVLRDWLAERMARIVMAIEGNTK